MRKIIKNWEEVFEQYPQSGKSEFILIPSTNTEKELVAREVPQVLPL